MLEFPNSIRISAKGISLNGKNEFLVFWQQSKYYMTTSVTAAPLDTNKWLLEVSFEVPKEDYTNVLPILVLDISGSMQYELPAAVSGARQLLRGYLENGCGEVMLIRYHTIAHTSTYHTLEDLNRFTARSEGMTNFSAAIAEIIKAISHANSTKHQPRVYFMTDGQNTVDRHKLSDATQHLRAALTSSKIPATIDVIGFTQSHDVNLLNSFAQMTGEGTFQYAETGDTLEEIVGDLLAVSGNKRTVTLGWGNQHVRVTAIRDDDGTFRAVRQTSHAPTNELRVHVTGKDPINVPIIKKELTDETRQRFRIQHIRDTLQELTQRVSKLHTPEERTAFNHDLQEIDTEIDSLVGGGDLFRDLTREQRRLVRQNHLEYKDTVAQLYKARSKNLSTTEYATLLSTASAHITKTGFQKKLQQRVFANMENTDVLTARERGKALHFDSEPVNDSRCVLTLENYQELAKSGDCLCLALSISRNQTAIADPSQVRIHTIQPSLISLDAFRDVVDLKLVGGDAVADGSVVHGGFQHSLGKSATVLQGMAREKINAVFPVYFDEQSWSIARLRIKEALSWMATITWQGWSFSQVELIPPMILAQGIREYNAEPSELKQHTVELLERTCRAISEFKSDAETLGAQQQRQLAAFVADPAKRTVDVVPSIQCLVGIAYTQNRDIFQDPAFVELVWEEYLRRELRWQLSGIHKAELMTKIAGKLHIDVKRYAEVLVTAGDGGAEAEMIKNKLQISDATGAAPVQAGSARLTDAEWVWDPVAILPGDVQQAREVWLTVNGWFHSTPLDFPADTICLAASVQNMLQASNSERREAISKGKYRSPWRPGAVIQGIGDSIIQYFREEAWARHVAAHGNNSAAEFAATGNLFQAAGLILAWPKTLSNGREVPNVCNHNLSRFAMALGKPSPCALEKMQMLLSGEFTYQGKTVPLLNYGWKDVGSPKRTWIHRWWLGNGRGRSGEEAEAWNTVFPEYQIGGYWDETWTRILEQK